MKLILILMVVVVIISFVYSTYDRYRTNRFLRQIGFCRKRLRSFASQLEISSSAPPEGHLIVPLSKPVAVAFPNYLQTMKWRRQAFAVIRYASFTVLISLAVFILLAASYGKPPKEFDVSDVHADIIYLSMAIMPLAFFVALILTPVAVYYTRMHYLRILLLRPFGQRRLGVGLRRVIVQQFGIFGNVFTLSDRNYRTNLILAVIMFFVDVFVLVLGAVFRPSPRGARVKNERTFLKFAGSLHKRVWPNYRSFIVGDQACNIKSRNEWWRLCIDLMMNSSELIIMDVSYVGAGSEWEIVHLDRRGLLRDCIFMAQEGYETVGIEKLSQILEARPVPRIFLYRLSGEFLDPDELNAEIQRRLLKVFPAEDVAAPASRANTAMRLAASTWTE